MCIRDRANAFNDAFQALNARMATLKNPDTGKALGGVGTTDVNAATLGSERNFTSTYVGQDSLGELMAAHPNIPYQVNLPSGFMDLLITLLPIIAIGALLFFFFNSMQKANNSQMSFGKAKTKKSIEERPDVKFSDVAGVDEACLLYTSPSWPAWVWMSAAARQASIPAAPP